MGSTPSGSDWCMKALHPSDPIVDVAGIPDKSCVPSTFLNYQTVARVGAATGSTGTWSYDGSLVPHPVQFMTHRVIDSINTGSGLLTGTLNAQLEGTTHRQKFTAFRHGVRRWRLAYASVTVHQDGPDLANQGTIVVAQVPITPKVYNPSFQAYRDDGVGGFTLRRLVVGPHLSQFTLLDRPNYAASQAMPNAYFNKSKFGAYVPLKLTRTCQQWHGESDNMAVLPYNTENDPDEEGYSFETGNALLTANSGLVGAEPFPDVQPYGVSFYAATDDRAATTAGFFNGGSDGDLTSALCNDVIAHISARNLSVDTSLTFFIRFGFEVQVLPTSFLSPHLKISPPHDSRALKTYFAIAREMKDAYPADHNDLGKIVGVISTIAKGLGPALGQIPQVGAYASQAANIVGNIAQGIHEQLLNARSREGNERAVSSIPMTSEKQAVAKLVRGVSNIKLKSKPQLVVPKRSIRSTLGKRRRN